MAEGPFLYRGPTYSIDKAPHSLYNSWQMASKAASVDTGKEGFEITPQHLARTITLLELGAIALFASQNIEFAFNMANKLTPNSPIEWGVVLVSLPSALVLNYILNRFIGARVLEAYDNWRYGDKIKQARDLANRATGSSVLSLDWTRQAKDVQQNAEWKKQKSMKGNGGQLQPQSAAEVRVYEGYAQEYQGVAGEYKDDAQTLAGKSAEIKKSLPKRVRAKIE